MVNPLWLIGSVPREILLPALANSCSASRNQTGQRRRRSARRSAPAHRDRAGPRPRRACAWSRCTGRIRSPGTNPCRNRASDVPPLVEASGTRPVSASTALATRSEKRAGQGEEGLARNHRARGARRGARRFRHPAASPCAGVRSLKRIEMRALALRRDDVGGGIADRNVGNLEVRWLEPVGPARPAPARRVRPAMRPAAGAGLSARCG
jgi:hypothetical protein